jgi:hypothetical protein
MSSTRCFGCFLLASILLTAACQSPPAQRRTTEIVQAEDDPGDDCSSYVEVDLDSCVCADDSDADMATATVPASSPSRAPRPLDTTTSPSGSSVTVQLWTDPANCIPCARLARLLPTTFYCDGEDVTITYVRNRGRNPRGGTIPTATINGSTVSGTTAIMNLIQGTIDSLPCD